MEKRPWEKIVEESVDAHDAIRRAETNLPGIESDRDDDPRWQAILAVGDFIESDPEPVWEFIRKFGRSPDTDLRTAVACCLLEHLLEHHFSTFIDRIEQECVREPLFADSLSRCWEFGQSELPENAARLNALLQRLGYT